MKAFWRMLSLLLALIILMGSWFPDKTKAEAGEMPSRYASYREIPGVTEDEINIIEYIKNEREFLEFVETYSTNAFLTEGGGVGGFYVLMCERFSELFGIPFRLTIREQGEILPRLDAGESDFTCALPDAHRPEGRYSMVNTGIERFIHTFRINNPSSQPLSMIAQDRLLRYAFIKNSPIIHDLIRITAPFERIFVSDYAEALMKLQTGAIDAFCDYDTAAPALEAPQGIISSEYLPLMRSPIFIATANHDLRPFTSVLEKYMLNGGLEEIKALHEQGQMNYRRSMLLATLTQAERGYLRAHSGLGKPIYFAASFDNYPICFYNETHGGYQGISIEVLDEISALTGFEFVPSNNVGEPWKDLLKELEEGRTDFASELMYTNARKEHFLWADEPYSIDSYALISTVSAENIAIHQIPQYTIALIAGTAYTEMFREWFPNHNKTVEFTNYAEAFGALSEGRVDFVMGTKNLLLNNANYLENTGFRANILFDYEYGSAYGFHASQGMLRSIMSKAQKMVDVESIAQRWTLRIYDYKGQLDRMSSESSLRMMMLVYAAAILFAIFLLILFLRKRHASESLNRALEATVRLRTAELEEQTEFAKVASMAKTNFLARMSHEIRTPLNAIIGMSRIARQAADPGSKVAYTLDDVISASLHLLGILNDVLDMTKIESGKFVLTTHSFYIKVAMQEVVNIIAQSCLGKGLTLVQNVDALPALVVVGDDLRLKQVLINLLGNAVKFTPAGGNIYMNIDCMTTQSTATLVFTVRDDGIGIPADQLERIYHAFEQANPSIATRFGGVGLGLSISQNLVNLMGGTISVESKVDSGSKFAFTLTMPLDRIFDEDAEPSENLNVDLTGKRILIAEDVEINRMILCEFLIDTHAEIDEAVNGLVALNMFMQSPVNYYDLIFMDIQMPHMDGYVATESIRALDRPDAKSVPIIAVTANAYPEDIERALLSGMNKHMSKPVDLTQLLITLRDSIAT